MKIVKLTAENVKRLIAVEITPEGSVITIGGKNGAGKSSVLDSIAFALGGKSLVPEEPIRKGEKSARIEVDLGELNITREFKEDGSTTLTVKNNEGHFFSSPQKMLDKLLGKLTFDPLLFVHSSKGHQYDTLRDLVGLDTTFLDNERKKYYDERTTLNRDAKLQEAQLTLYPNYKDVPKEILSMKEISDKMLQADKLREEARQQEIIAEKKKEIIEAAQSRIINLNDNIGGLKQKILECQKDIQRAGAIVVKQVKVPNVEEIQHRIAEIEEINLKVHKNKVYFKAVHDHTEVLLKIAVLSKEIIEVDEKKKVMLGKVKYPIVGLKLKEGKVYFCDIPFKQCSTAEQLRVSVAMGLALNPELKILLIRDGNALDQSSLKEVAQLAEKADAQLWLERVSEDGVGVSVMIEAGVEIPNPKK